jgi:hypothetical protein
MTGGGVSEAEARAALEALAARTRRDAKTSRSRYFAKLCGAKAWREELGRHREERVQREAQEREERERAAEREAAERLDAERRREWEEAYRLQADRRREEAEQRARQALDDWCFVPASNAALSERDAGERVLGWVAALRAGRGDEAARLRSELSSGGWERTADAPAEPKSLDAERAAVKVAEQAKMREVERELREHAERRRAKKHEAPTP